ncbi:MAG: hypothetical protein KatS3mg057_3063 [Herpetosiphonaceae bacterium]|nr:MAG: hypothetical protein KatS3mg057_3063 [Herpetosiphonaceae bacterium]
MLENNVTVSGEQFDPTLSNNGFIETTTVNGQVDLSIDMSDDPDPLLLGNLLQYTIVVSNTGPSDAVDVIVTDALPSGVIFVGASTGCNEDTPGSVICTIGSLASGASNTLLISVQPTVDGVFSNTVSVTSSPYNSDTVTSNNTATEQTTVVGYANLAVSQSASSSTVNATDLLTYTLSVANSGPNSARSITVTDALPDGTGFISASGSGWTCSYDGVLHEVSCTLPSLLITTAPDITIAITAPAEGGYHCQYCDGDG